VGPRFVRLAAVFYGLLVVAAAVWCGLRGIDLPVLGARPATGLLLGLATAAGTVTLSLLAYRLIPVTRKLAEELAPTIVDGTDGSGWSSSLCSRVSGRRSSSEAPCSRSSGS
jgi:hypothetical protein